MRYAVYPGLVSCPFYAIRIIIPFQINHLLVHFHFVTAFSNYINFIECNNKQSVQLQAMSSYYIYEKEDGHNYIEITTCYMYTCLDRILKCSCTGAWLYFPV